MLAMIALLTNAHLGKLRVVAYAVVAASQWRAFAMEAALGAVGTAAEIVAAAALILPLPCRGWILTLTMTAAARRM